MMANRRSSALILGALLCIGLVALGYLLGQSAVKVKEYERLVRVKGLAERELPANIVIWPIQYSAASNSLEDLYQKLDEHAAVVRGFLVERGIQAEEVSVSAPAVTDKSAQQYGNERSPFRFVGTQTVTVYSEQLSNVRGMMGAISELGKQGVVLRGDHYDSRPEYIFNQLNDIKPAMIEESTKNARQVAEKFAADSNSRLGKIKRASQGQFSIQDRDRNNPHIKKIRVVSTVEYYLSD
ncbi:SIMPL domain-containing protein [Pseudoteredinibacter isoporae]|uniref:SIMPL domain-containing protein n=1 Tax=Pseudoteredinibacter isoporae TaxID=570281 RepID=UPI0031061245